MVYTEVYVDETLTTENERCPSLKEYSNKVLKEYLWGEVREVIISE
jgi:hypothetical protein